MTQINGDNLGFSKRNKDEETEDRAAFLIFQDLVCEILSFHPIPTFSHRLLETKI